MIGMKCPKYVSKLLDKRINSAFNLREADTKLVEWLEKNNIAVEEYDILGGCEMYVNPYNSAERIREAIERHVSSNDI